MKTNMRNIVLMLAGFSLLLVACNKESISVDTPKAARIETLTVQTESETKVNVNAVGALSWTSGDEIAVWKGTDASTGSYISCEVEGESVSVPLEAGESRYNYAIYPSTDKVDANYSAASLQVALPGAYDITGKDGVYSPVPMIALQTETETLTFKTLTGLLRLNVIGVPNTTTTLTVNIGDNKIVGTYNVANVPTAEHPEYTPSIAKSESGSTSIVYTIHATGTVGGAEVVLNIPLPLGSYSAGTITVTAKDASNRVLDTKTKDYSAFTVVRNQGKKATVNFGTLCGLVFSSGNLYTTVDGEGHAVLHVAADPFEHMINYTDQFTSGSYSLNNRAHFNWNETKILMDGGTPTYATSQTKQNEMAGKVIDGYYWEVLSKEEADALISTTRTGSTVNGTPGFSYTSVVVDLSETTYAGQGLSTATTGAPTNIGSNYIYGPLFFPDAVTIDISADFSAAKNAGANPVSISYAQLQTLLTKGCKFYPGSGFYRMDGSNGWAPGRVGTSGYYWTSTTSTSDDNNASDFVFRFFEPTPYGTTETLPGIKKDYYYLPVWLVRRYVVGS